ncbi:hypothetical protein HDE_01141 [Halotydeus destructor]|nr:hypothetical protein HDE_01141 [Halotydeus destructor]
MLKHLLILLPLVALVAAQVNLQAPDAGREADLPDNDQSEQLQAILVAAPNEPMVRVRSPCGHAHHAHDHDHSESNAEETKEAPMNPLSILLQLAYSNMMNQPPKVPRWEEKMGRPPCRCGCRCGHGQAQSPCGLCNQRADGYRPSCCGARYTPQSSPYYAEASTGYPVRSLYSQAYAGYPGAQYGPYASAYGYPSSYQLSYPSAYPAYQGYQSAYYQSPYQSPYQYPAYAYYYPGYPGYASQPSYASYPSSYYPSYGYGAQRMAYTYAPASAMSQAPSAQSPTYAYRPTYLSRQAPAYGYMTV